MVKRLLIGGLLGGLALFIWQGIWWGVVPFMMSQLNPIPEGERVALDLGQQGMESGLYYFPAHPKPTGDAAADKAAWELMTEQAKRGPTITFMAYQAEGYDPMGVSWYIQGLLCDIAAAIVVTLLIGLVAGALPAYGQRVLFCGGIGLAGALVGPVVFSGFFILPPAFAIGQLIDAVMSWLVAGLLIALATKPSAKSAALSA